MRKTRKRRGSIKMFAVYFNEDKERNGHIETVNGKMTISEAFDWCKAQAKESDAYFAYTTRPALPHYASQKFKL